MTEIKLFRDTVRTTVIDDNAALADLTRAAGDYDNSTELDLGCEVYLKVQYDVSLPAAGDRIADLWLLPGLIYSK